MICFITWYVSFLHNFDRPVYKDHKLLTSQCVPTTFICLRFMRNLNYYVTVITHKSEFLTVCTSLLIWFDLQVYKIYLLLNTFIFILTARASTLSVTILYITAKNQPHQKLDCSISFLSGSLALETV